MRTISIGVISAMLACAPAADAQTVPTEADIARAKQHVVDLERAKLQHDLAQANAQAAAITAQIAALGPQPAAAPPPAPVAPVPARAPAPALAAAPVAAQDAPETEGLASPDQESGQRDFGGIKFGVGISLTSDIGNRDRIGDAAVDEAGIVRVSDMNNNRARIMLESHYFFTPCRNFLFFRTMRNDCYEAADPENAGHTITKVRARWGFGPFIALQPGGDKDVIDAIGLGMMVGFRRGTDTTQSFNFGLGYVIDPNTRVLGDGVVANKPLPPNETQVRFQEDSQTGLLFLASFSF